MESGITISVASGKGGTGKTTIATNLALVLTNQGNNVAYIDCDVEEPNGHIFLRPEINESRPVEVAVPEVNYERCNFCRKCSEICEFNALAVLADKVLIFPSLCHSCGGCYYACPEDAIREVPRTIGELKIGSGQGIGFYEGRLNIGEAISPPITRALKKFIPDCDIAIIDAPPGTSCPVVEAVKNTDFVILVTEPTPFGLHDLELAVEMVKALGLPFGVIINRYDEPETEVEAFCRREKIEVMMKIGSDRRLAEVYSIGGLPLAENPDYSKALGALYDQIVIEIKNNGTGHSKR